MQLKTVGESLRVGDVIKDVTDKCSYLKGTFNEAATMGFKLGDATKGFSLEAVKAALSQTDLNENVIRGVLAQQGLKDELLETATKEVMAAASAKKLGESEGIAAVFTKNLKDALRGLGKGLKELALFLTTNPIGWIIDVIGAVVAISAIYKKFTTSAKEAREALDNSLTASANKVKEVREQKETVDQLAESYEKLSKGVNTSTNQNISLSTDSYKEYLDVCNQIADLYPDLVTGYDSQGNAILSLKGNVDQLTESYKQAQQEAYAMAYLGEKDEDGNYSGGITEAKRLWEYNSSKMSKTDNFWVDTSYAQSLFNTKDSQLDEAKKLLAMSDDDFKKEFNSLVVGNTTILSEFGISIDKMGELTTSKIQDFKSKIQLFVNDTQETMNDSVSDIAKTLEGYMKGITDASGSALASGYDKLTEEQQNFATSLLSSLDLDTLQAFENSGDFEGAAKKWVDNLVSSVSNMSAEAKNAYNQLQDSIAHPDDLMTSDINQLDKYLDTLSNNLKISKDKLKEIFNLDDIFDTETSFSNKLNELLNSTFDGADLDAANDALDNYKEVIQEAQNLGLDLSQTVFGNIDTNNRQVLEWTNDTLNQYKDALQSWDEEALNNWDQFASDMKGSISTVFGSSAEYDGVEIAFSPMLQTENGAVLLSSDTVDTYINSLISELGENWNNEDLLALDAKGLDVDGTHIKNLIADIGDTAIQTGEAMHYMGQDGAIALAARDVEEYSDVLKDSIDVTSSAQKANDSNSQSLSKSTKSIKTNSQAIKWMKENCDQMTLSQKKMFLEAATDAQSPLETIQKFHDLIANNALNSLSVDISNVTDHITNLNTALSESASATGLTADSITNLKNMFSGLDDYDESKLFENTANGIKLNREELEKLNKAYDDQNREDIAEQLDTLTDSYNDLTEQIENCNNVADLPNLYSQRDAILDQIEDVQALASQYDGLTSAFNEWTNAQNETAPSANYDSMYSYLETANELASEGKWGDPALQKFLKLLTGEDMSEKTGMQLKEVWENLDKPIQNTSHNLMEFLTEGSEGSQAFIDTLQQLDDKYVQLGEDGSISINIDDMGDLAKKMGTDISYVQVLLDNLSEYGYKVHVDSTDLELTKTKAEEANEALNESLKQKGQQTYTFNFDADPDSIQGEVDKAKEMFDSIKASGDTDDLQRISVIYTQLLAQKEALQRPLIMQIKTDDLDSTQQKAITTFQTLQNCIDGYQIALETGTDTTDLRASIEETLDSFDNVSNDIKEKLGMNSEEFKNAIATLKQNIADGVELDPGAISTIESQFANIDPEILAKIGIDTSSMNETIDSTTQAFQDALTNVLDGLQISLDWSTMSVKITADTSELDSAVDDSNNKVDNMHDGNSTLTSDNTDAMTKEQEAIDKAEDFNGSTYQAKMNTVADSTQADTLIGKLKGWFMKIGAGIYQATVKTSSSGSTPSTGKTPTSNYKSGVAKSGYQYAHASVNGTFHGFADGTFLRGYNSGTNVALKTDEDALVNELGNEGLLRDGVLYEIPGNAHIEHLKKHDIIFNVRQMDELRKYGYVQSGGGRGQLIGGYAYGTLTGLPCHADTKKYKADIIGSQLIKNQQSTKTYGSSSSSSKSSSGSSSKSSGSSSSSKSSSGSSSSSSSTDTSSDAEETKETLDWIETKISRVERLISNLGKTVSATYKSWSERNNALSSELSQVNSEISIQQQAYNRYMQEANNVGLDAGYAQKVRDGKIDIETITDDDLKEKISQFKEFYEKALDCQDTILDLKDDLYDLAQTNFDNVTTQFEQQLKVLEQQKGLYETFMDEVETAGYLVSADYYTTLINTEKKNIAVLENEFNSLSSAFGEAVKTGNIVEGSEAWNEMYLSILDVQTAIEDANKSLIEYQTNLRKLNWDRFDKLEDYISEIQTESDFLIDLMSNQTLYDEDTGKDTKYATTLKGLHAVNYNAYMAQSDDYAKEISNIDKDLANDPYNTTLIERRQELLKLQQEAIKNAEDEKQSIKSLVKDGFDAMKDALDNIISKRKETLDSAKDLYDYEQNISDQTKNIASLRKQLIAISGDDSEETQAKRQQLNQSISDAEKELQNSEYDQWKSDQEAMLDNLSSEVEEWLNSRLDDLNGLIQNVIDQTNANASTIGDTIKTETGDVGYTITDQMKQIWTSSDGLAGVVTMYGNNFQNTATNTLNTINSIKLYVENLSKKADADAAAKIKAAEAKQAAATKPATSTTKTTTTNTNTQKQNTSSSSSSGNFFVYRKDSYPKSKLNINNSIVDRLKYRDYASDFNNRRNYYASMGLGSASSYTGSASQNKSMINWMNFCPV